MVSDLADFVHLAHQPYFWEYAPKLIQVKYNMANDIYIFFSTNLISHLIVLPVFLLINSTIIQASAPSITVKIFMSNFLDKTTLITRKLVCDSLPAVFHVWSYLKWAKYCKSLCYYKKKLKKYCMARCH
jgi:hypothetical protein